MQLQESGQMYLETILVLSRTLPAVRSIDIVEHMGYSKPSVSRAMGLLKNGGFIVVDEDGYITLTEDGREIATKIYERHTSGGAGMVFRIPLSTYPGKQKTKAKSLGFSF